MNDVLELLAKDKYLEHPARSTMELFVIIDVTSVQP